MSSTNNKKISSLIKMIPYLLLLIVLIAAFIISSLKSNPNEKNEPLFHDININEYIDLFKGEELSPILVGRPDCSFSSKAYKYLNNVIREYGIVIYYLNINHFSYQAKTLFEESHEVFTDQNWGTPMVLLVQKQDIIKKIDGFVTGKTEEEYLDMFIEANLIEK